jgi:hypothetical protein
MITSEGLLKIENGKILDHAEAIAVFDGHRRRVSYPPPPHFIYLALNEYSNAIPSW